MPEKSGENSKNSENISAILSEIRAIREENSYYKTVCSQLVEKTNVLEKEVNSLKGELNYMRQDKLRNNLIIHGVPKLTNEGVVKVIPAIVKSLKLSCPPVDYTVTQIVTKKKTSLLLVKFNNSDLKLKFIKAIKDQGLTTDQIGIVGKSRKIFFTHHLTYDNLNLLQQSQILKKDHQFEFVWFQSGVVLARKKKETPIHRIKTADDLKKIIEETTVTIVESEDENSHSPVHSRNINTRAAGAAGGSQD